MQIFKEEAELEEVGEAPCTTYEIRSLDKCRKASKSEPSHGSSKEKYIII